MSSGISMGQLQRAIDRVPMLVRRRGNLVQATLTLPAGRGGRPITYRATVKLENLGSELGASDELAGRLSRRVKRRLRRGAVGRIGKRLVRVAKRVAKSKVLRAAWKSMPVWANLVPPPAGQALAAGAAAAQVAMRVAAAAKKGHRGAREVLRGIKNLKRTKVKAVLDTRKALALTKGLPPAKRAAAVRRVLNRTGLYLVKTPTGRTVRIPASQVAA